MTQLSRLLATRTALTGLAVFSLLSMSGPAAWSGSAQQQPADREAAATSQSLSQGHADFRKAVVAELRKVATKRDEKLDFASLIITSCNDGCMLAGVAASRAPQPKEPQLKEPQAKEGQPKEGQPKEPAAAAPGAAKLDTHEPLGLVVVAGTALSVRSRTIDASGPGGAVPGKGEGTVGVVQLRPGFYEVRRGPRANVLELVDADQKVAVTVPFQPGPGRGGKGERGAPDQNPELSDASEWPTIYLELLHAVDLGH